MSASTADARAILTAWGRFYVEVAPLVAPIELLMRAAAADDPAIAKVRDAAQEQRLARMRHNAKRLADRGWLRSGVSLDQAADVMWTLTSSELYDLLVLRRGWTPADVGDFVARSMIAALL